MLAAMEYFVYELSTEHYFAGSVFAVTYPFLAFDPTRRLSMETTAADPNHTEDV